jgi:predicted amidohydrolase
MKMSYLLLFLILLNITSTSFGQDPETALADSGIVRIAACQFPVSNDIEANSDWIRRQTKAAKEKGAEIVHFSECALSGYIGHEYTSVTDIDWDVLINQTKSIMELSDSLNVWIILGSTHRLSGSNKPHNSLYVINPEGEIIDRYDKRFCTENDLKHYSPGDHFVTFDINGVRCGLLICYDVRFPELYREYRKLGVDLIFQSFYNSNKSDKHIHPIIMPLSVRARAATNYFFISLTNTSKKYSWPCYIITPNGLVADRLLPDRPGVLVGDINTNKSYYDASAPFRMDAIHGKLNSGDVVNDLRSADREGF